MPLHSHASSLSFFFFNDTATTEIYTLSLHDALPISPRASAARASPERLAVAGGLAEVTLAQPAVVQGGRQDRKSTRLNSSHSQISYAVFCLKKKKKKKKRYQSYIATNDTHTQTNHVD